MSVLLTFSKNQLLTFLIFSIVFWSLFHLFWLWSVSPPFCWLWIEFILVFLASWCIKSACLFEVFLFFLTQAINFPHRTSFCSSPYILVCYVSFPFLFASHIFWFPTQFYLWLVCLISAYLWILQISFCYWLWSENILYMISILLNLLRFVLWSECGLSWFMICRCLRRMCILLSDGVFYKCWLDMAGWWCSKFHIHTVFFSGCSVKCWERSVDVSKCNYVYFFFQFDQFLVHKFCISGMVYTYFTAMSS